MASNVHQIDPRRQEKKKRGRKPPPPGETARERFVRIGNRRMENALQAIGLLGNLAAPNYQWTPEDLERMTEALFAHVEKTFARFELHKKPEKPTFDLG